MAMASEDNKSRRCALDEGSEGGAGLSGVALEARADAGVIVALAAAATLVGVVVGGGGLLDGGLGSLGELGGAVEGDVDAGGEGVLKAIKPGGAASATRVDIDLKEVLLSVDGGSGESDHDDEGGGVGDGYGGNRDAAVRAATDDLVGESLEGSVDISSNISKAGSVSGGKLDGDGGEGLVHLGGEGEREGLASEIGKSGLGVLSTGPGARSDTSRVLATGGSSGEKGDGLDLRDRGDTSVGTEVHDVISVGAHAGGAVDSVPPSITHTGTGAVSVPVVGGGGDDTANAKLAQGVGGGVVVLVEDSSEGKLVHVLASSVPRARVGAGLAAAGLALKPAKASALSSLTVAHTLGGALSVGVSRAGACGGVSPRELEGAEACM